MPTKREWLAGRTDAGEVLPADRVADYRTTHAAKRNLEAVQAEGKAPANMLPVPQGIGAVLNCLLSEAKLPKLSQNEVYLIDSHAWAPAYMTTCGAYSAARAALDRTLGDTKLPQLAGGQRDQNSLRAALVNKAKRQTAQRDAILDSIEASGNEIPAGMFCSKCGRPRAALKDFKFAVQPGSMSALQKLGIRMKFSSPEAKKTAAAISGAAPAQ